MIALYRSKATGILFELLYETMTTNTVVDILAGTVIVVPSVTFDKYMRVEPTYSPNGGGFSWHADL